MTRANAFTRSNPSRPSRPARQVGPRRSAACIASRDFGGSTIAAVQPRPRQAPITFGFWLRWRLCLALVSTALAACAGLSVDRMVPTDPVSATQRFDRTLRIAPVTGGRSPDFGGPAVVSSEMMREALVAALGRSNLFRAVDAERSGDYDLHAQIYAQTQDADSLDYVASLGVRYRLVDSRSGAEVWRRELNSRYLVAVSSALSGATRTVTAREQSVRDNLARLVRDLASLDLQ